MDPVVFALVLGAALLHASWNALVKTGGDPFVRLALVNLVSGLCALPFIPWWRSRRAPAWPYLFGSIVVHHAYYLALAYGYRFGDLSHVYPIARGVAPPLVAFVAWAFAGEAPGALGLVAILVISSGIVSLAFTDDGRLAALKPMGFALATGVAIAGYTLCDGLGGRSAGDVFGYIVWLFVYRRLAVRAAGRLPLPRPPGRGAGRRLAAGRGRRGARGRRLRPGDLGDDPDARWLRSRRCARPA